MFRNASRFTQSVRARLNKRRSFYLYEWRSREVTPAHQMKDADDRMKELGKEILPFIRVYDPEIALILQEHRLQCLEVQTQVDVPRYEEKTDTYIHQWTNYCSNALIIFRYTGGERCINVEFYSLHGEDASLLQAFRARSIPGIRVLYSEDNTAQILLNGADPIA